MEKIYCNRDTLTDKNPSRVMLTIGKMYEKIRTTCNGDFVVINDSGVKGKYTPSRFDTPSQHREKILNELLNK